MVEDIQSELLSLQAEIEEITGLRSRWSGRVVLFDDSSTLKATGALAEKSWNCDIRVSHAIASHPIRWRTLLHELLHSVSAGLDVESYARFQGWEEAVVESLQRTLRPQILHRLAIEASETLMVQLEQQWRYNSYIEAMESLRLYLQRDKQDFYLEMLRVPLADRLSYAYAFSDTHEYRRLLALASGKLR